MSTAAHLVTMAFPVMGCGDLVAAARTQIPVGIGSALRCRSSIHLKKGSPLGIRCAEGSSSQVVITATRPLGGSGSAARVIGPGSEVPSIGRILGLDEFFGRSNRKGLPDLDENVFLETLVYYLGGRDETESTAAHGVQIYLKSKIKKRSDTASMIVHTREASYFEPKLIVGTKGGGAAKIKVVTGNFAGVSTPSPLNDFLTLDVSMRPESDAVFPIKASYGIVIYILEGAAVIRHNRLSEEEESVSYQNEGHGLWIPPAAKASNSSKTNISVATHPCSHLRFIVLAANHETK